MSSQLRSRWAGLLRYGTLPVGFRLAFTSWCGCVALECVSCECCCCFRCYGDVMQRSWCVVSLVLSFCVGMLNIDSKLWRFFFGRPSSHGSNARPAYSTLHDVTACRCWRGYNKHALCNAVVVLYYTLTPVFLLTFGTWDALLFLCFCAFFYLELVR